MDVEDFLDPDEIQALRRQADGPGDGSIDPDTLHFKDHCEGCSNTLTWIDPAFICAYECTWCPECAEDLGMVCPNCSGELVRRPKRTQPGPSKR